MAQEQLAGGFRPLLARYAGSGMPRRCLAAYVGCTKWAWNHLPATLRRHRFGLAYGRHVNFLVRRDARRSQSFATLFLRNRAELTLMLRLLEQRAEGSSLSITVLACSKGAEVYSILWAIRSARPDLKVVVQAVDISPAILAFAEQGFIHWPRRPVHQQAWLGKSLRRASMGRSIRIRTRRNGYLRDCPTMN